MNSARTMMTGVTVLGLVATAGLLMAGPLNPPAGPVTSTYKTLSEVEPRTAVGQPVSPANGSAIVVLSQSGSYYLTSNIVAPANFQGSGIQIGADDISLDLNGFSIIGNGLGNSVSSGITTANNTGKRLTVKNGSLKGWAGSGLDTSLTGATNATIVDVHAQGNGVDGFSTNSDSVLERCTSSGNAADGFGAGMGNTIIDCVADNNSSAGFRPGTGSTLRGCTARFNPGTGFTGSSAGSYQNCTARQNGSGGFTVSTGSTLTGCLADGNGSYGFNLVSGCTATGCTAASNSGATADGFVCSAIGDSCVLTNCLAVTNGRDGFSLSNNCLASGCVARQNAGNEFKGISGNTFLGCTASGPVSGSVGANAAFTATGARNRFEGCQALRHAKGFEATTTVNIYLRNTASGNTDNYGQVAAGNYIGTIVTTAAAFGTNTNANANISY